MKGDTCDSSEFDCFGEIEPSHPECLKCGGRNACASEAGIIL